MKTKQIRQFVPRYKLVINYFAPYPYKTRTCVCFFDYFLKDIHGQFLFDFIRDNFAVPFENTSFNIFRLPD